MRNSIKSFAARISVVLIAVVGNVAMAQKTNQPTTSTPATTGAEVTLIGMMHGTLTVWRPGQPEDKPNSPILFAFEGTPAVEAAFQDVFKELIASNSINYQQSKTIEEEMHKLLKYYVTTNDVTEAARRRWDGTGNGGGGLHCVTGVLSEKDGRRFITPSKISDKRPDGKKWLGRIFKYPDGFYAPDKPFKMPGKTPLILKVTDALSLKCILLPRGEFMFRLPFWYPDRWRDTYPRHITLTKPYWLAEIAVTQEMWDAVMGAENDFSTVKGPQLRVRNMYCPEINQFCKILSEKNNRTVRLPGDAEWEYAARVGTSNPLFSQKYKDQDCGFKVPEKSKSPNAWGIYGMINGGGFEFSRDYSSGGSFGSHLFCNKDEVDPHDACEPDEAAGKFHRHFSNPNIWFHEENPGIPPKDPKWKRKTDASYASPSFRVAVEATPEEIAEMEKAESVSGK